MKKSFVIRDERIRLNALRAVRELPTNPIHQLKISQVKSIRSLDQNAKMWAMLHDISRQVDWYGEKLSPENWKDMITAALNRQKVVPGIEGGFVALGSKTSKMSIRDMIDVIDFACAFGADKNVKWTDPKELMERFDNEHPAPMPEM